MPVGIYTAIVKTGVWDEVLMCLLPSMNMYVNYLSKAFKLIFFSLNLLSVIIIKNTGFLISSVIICDSDTVMCLGDFLKTRNEQNQITDQPIMENGYAVHRRYIL